MEIATKIDREKGIRIHTVSGELTFREQREILLRLYDDPEFDPTLNALWDYRQVVVTDLSSEQVRDAADLVGERWNSWGSIRVALVVAKDLDFGLARMFEQWLAGRNESEVRVFRDYDEALGWLAAGR